MSNSDHEYLKIADAFLGSPDCPNSPAAATWVEEGYLFEANKVGKEAMAFDACKSAMDLSLPHVLIQGRDDHVTPADAALAYGQDVRAPHKVVVAIDGGHFACFTNSRDFVAALHAHVLPLAR